METDKLAAVRDMYEMVVGKFRTSYLPSSSITVDERISPFKGRVGFKVNNFEMCRLSLRMYLF